MYIFSVVIKCINFFYILKCMVYILMIMNFLCKSYKFFKKIFNYLNFKKILIRKGFKCIVYD